LQPLNAAFVFRAPRTRALDYGASWYNSILNTFVGKSAMI